MCCAAVQRSMTVGAPMAMHFTPRVESESSFRAFSTPLPGEMPVLQSCIVLPRFESSLQASASTAMTACGLTRSAIAFTCSEDSIQIGRASCRERV